VDSHYHNLVVKCANKLLKGTFVGRAYVDDPKSAKTRRQLTRIPGGNDYVPLACVRTIPTFKNRLKARPRVGKVGRSQNHEHPAGSNDGVLKGLLLWGARTDQGRVRHAEAGLLEPRQEDVQHPFLIGRAEADENVGRRLVVRVVLNNRTPAAQDCLDTPNGSAGLVDPMRHLRFDVR
jgi:hypothetical protein